jgi:hypothetical protein
MNLSRDGLRLLDTYFKEARHKTITKGWSWYSIQQNEERMEFLRQKSIQYRESAYKVFQLWYGTVNQFRPAIAKYIYTRYQPTCILDISAGWGGRCLAAIQMGIPYIGIDSNTNLKPCYDALLQDHPGNVIMHYQPSETFDFTSIQYDMIFTSPPYFMLERYENMPKYKSKQDFLDTFFLPVIRMAWENLKEGGTMVLNMPCEMYNALEMEATEILQMPIASRFGGKLRSENIYVWRKHGL